MVEQTADDLRKRYGIYQVFRPGAPIEKGDLFKGRAKQLRQILGAIAQPGRHAVVYGERGVGKTSLGHIMAETLETADPKALISGTINCDSTDTFASLWHKVFRELTISMQVKGIGLGGMSPDATYTLDSLLNEGVRPDDVRFSLSQLRQSTVIMLDEFDKLREKPEVTNLMADTIKNLSDHTLEVTLVLIGVADNIDELVAGHKSVERSLDQIPVPRMTNEELRQIINGGVTSLEMTITDEAANWIVSLSKGLPHFTHLLARDAALNAFDGARTEINDDDVFLGIRSAAGNEHSLMKAYQDAIVSPQKTSRFAEVLLACAQSPTDPFGWFAPATVCEPLSKLTSRRFDVPSFSRHLNAFCQDERGPALESRGESRRTRYRFVNPLMQPFVILQGFRTGMIKPKARPEQK